MRAGSYADWRGERYRASFSHDSTQVDLLADPGSSPEGFTPDRWGRPRRLVDRAEVSRLEVVTTVAVWQGRRVDVLKVEGEEAVVQQWAWPVPEHPSVRVVENGLWEARVPVGELTEVVESVTEIPV